MENSHLMVANVTFIKRNEKLDYEMNGVRLESVQCVKDLWSNVELSQQCKDITNEDNKMLAFINTNVPSDVKKCIIFVASP